MKKYIVGVCLTLLMTGTASATEFCDGFEAGYKSIKGEFSFAPFCPFEPFTPFNSSPYKEGLKAGIQKGNQGSKTSYDATSGNTYNTYNDGSGNTTVNGFNSKTGSVWRNQVDQNGRQSGTDSEGNYWTYRPSTKIYTSTSGKICTGVGTSYENCTGG